MDVKIKSDEGNFKFRVSGLVLHNDRVLTVNINDNGFYCLPGGHVHLGEDTDTAMRREIYEEIGVKAKDVKLMSVIESFFLNKQNKTIHEIGFYYIITPEDLGDKVNDFSLIENDEGELKNLEFKWIGLDEMIEANFRPSILKEKLKNRDFSFTHIINM